MEFLAQNWMWASLAGASGALLIFIYFLENTSSDNLSAAQAVLLLNRQSAQLIDIRAKADYEQVHILQSRSMPATEFPSMQAQWGKLRKKVLVIIAGTETQAASFMRTLRKEGFEDIYRLRGGLSAWKEAGLPVSTKAKT